MAREIKSQTATTETVVKRTAEETQEQVKVKKTKKEEVTVKKKKSGWEPFDPSLPNNMTFPTSFNFPKKPENTITFASYNVASLSASIKKGFNKYVDAEDADILCVQETKVNKPLDTAVSKEIYPHQYWTFSSKKGYAGIAVFSKFKPKEVTYGIPKFDGDQEGRVITLEFDNNIVLIASYVPNAGDKLVRLPERRIFNDHMEKYIRSFQKEGKSVIWTGDLNVAHTPNDLARPATNERSAGFTIEERTDFSKVLNPSDDGLPGLVDTWRHFHPEQKGHYTYYSYRFKCREKLIGWRLDYFTVTPDLLDKIVSSEIRHEAWGASDHVPIILTLKDVIL
ncbi:Putative Exodeoxyribonuclease III [Rhizopus microsporus]|nr:Putative Exodeoxyribonuclease III [Rhizopus microsporus]CEI90891.1 Putative Exodeoxyribonuclease III [Rhizopus microsporus]